MKEVLKRVNAQRVENNSPYLKSMHKYWITEDTNLPFYSIHFKLLLASYAFLLLFFTV